MELVTLMLTRRKFGGFGLLSLAFGGLQASLFVPAVLADDNAALTPDLVFNDTGLMLFPGVQLNHSRQKAESLLNQRFYIQIADTGVVEVKLVDVIDHESTLSTEGFSMVFFTHWKPELSEGLYQVEEPSLGYFPLYFRPMENEGDGFFYEVSAVHLVRNRPE